MASTSLTATTAASAASFVSTLGVNTHIDFDAYGYQNIATLESNIDYLGVKILRDSAQSPTDATTWLQVAQATGTKFDDYVGENSPAGMLTDLGYVTQLAQEGILGSIEGGDEEDDSYPASLGNTLANTALFQQQVYALGQSLGLPVINMSFGAGWTAANDWEGDYGTVGDLSAYTNYGNAHTYPNVGQLPDAEIQVVNGLAKMAASTRPVITTEIGWQTTQFSLQTIAKYVLDAAMDGLKDGNAGMYFYGMYDDGSGDWGLFNSDGTPRPAATALHDLTTLLADTGSNAATFTPGSLTYGLSGTQTGDSSVLIEKSDGSFWLSLWNETETAGSPHTVTVNLAAPAATIVEYDPLTGTSSIANWSNVSSVQVSVPDHPILLEIIPATAGGSTGGTGSSGAGTTTSGGTSSTGSSGTTTGSSSVGGSTSTPTTTTPTGPVVTVPASENVTAGSTTAINGVSIADAFAASNPGTMTLNLSAGSGLLTITDASGNKAPGSGTDAITFNGTFAQIATELADLTYTAAGSAGTDSITVDVWDQAGLEGIKTIKVSVAAAPVSSPSPSGPVITVPGTLAVAPKSTTVVNGISVADAFAASSPGSMVLNVDAGSGTLTMPKASGSGTHAISFTGTFAQISYELAHISYIAATIPGSDSISVSVWDQAGLESTQSLAVSVHAPTPTMTAVTITSGNADPTITVDYAAISATSGNHMFFIGGSNDVLTATGGTETVQAFQGSNTITTGKGNDTIQIGGSGNIVNAGSGNNQIDDSGSNNTIVLPAGGQGMDDIYGYVLQNGDTLDLRNLLAGTKWNQNPDTASNYLQVSTPDGSDAVISVTPSGVAGGASYNVATLHGTGPVSLATVLAHSLL
jgi:serralysin